MSNSPKQNTEKTSQDPEKSKIKPNDNNTSPNQQKKINTDGSNETSEDGKHRKSPSNSIPSQPRQINNNNDSEQAKEEPDKIVLHSDPNQQEQINNNNVPKQAQTPTDQNALLTNTNPDPNQQEQINNNNDLKQAQTPTDQNALPTNTNQQKQTNNDNGSKQAKETPHKIELPPDESTGQSNKKSKHEEPKSINNIDDINLQKCTFHFGTQKRIINRQELPNDYRFFYSMSQIFQNFVRVEGQKKYKKNKILSEEATDIRLEKSLPLILFNDDIYLFSNKDELEDFYNSNNLYIKSIKFHEKEIKLNNLSIFEEEKLAFDCYLQIDAEKKITKKYEIDGKPIDIQTFEGASEEEQLEKIREEYYNNKKFVYLDLLDSNKITAKIRIQGDTEIECFEDILDSKIATNNFLDNLRNKYESKDISIDFKKDIKKRLLDNDYDAKVLKIKNLQLINLKIQGKEHIISKTNTINQIIEKISPTKSKGKYFLVDGKLIVNKDLPASNYKKSKDITILDLTEYAITLKFKCDNINITPIIVDPNNIEIIDSTEKLKAQIIENTHINREPNLLSVNDDNPILITEDMIGKDKKITIPLDVTLKKCTFFIVFEDRKKKLKLTNEKISSLASRYECDKIKLFNDNKEIKDDESFLFLTPEKEYAIELYDEYYISKPELKNSEESTVLLQRFKTFGSALGSLEGFENVPYKIFYKGKDITDIKIEEKIKTSKEKPLILKIDFEFEEKKTVKTLHEFFDNLDQNVIKYIANEIFRITKIDRVDAKIINKESGKAKEIKNDDTFGSIEYQKGQIIRIALLPPTLKFKFDTTDIENIQINKDSKIPVNYSNRFSDEATVKDAKEAIKKEFSIENDISFSLEKILKDDQLMFNISESSVITIKLLPPKYTFIFKENEYPIRFKTNLNISDVIKNPDFKKYIELKSPYHNIELELDNGKKPTQLKNDMKIFDLYKKGNIICNELDPIYNFSFNEKKEEIRIPDDTNFKKLRKYVQRQYPELKDIQPSRIFFYSSKNAKYKNKEIINKVCNKDRDLAIKLDDPKYVFALGKEVKKIRLKEDKTVGDAIKLLHEEFEANNFDIELKHELPDDTVLSKEKLYENAIKLRRVPLMFHFKINNSDDIIDVRFPSGKPIDSSKTSFQEIYDNRCIELHDDLINFDLLKEPSTKDTKLPPIGRFLIKDKDNSLHELDEPFLDIIKNDKEEIIQIELVPPSFLFKTRSKSEYILPFQVQRGKKVQDVKKDILDLFKLGKYDFYLKINNDKLTDEDDFDKYEQDEDQVFTIYPQNPLYSFKLSINGDESAPKKFRLNPSTTFREVKSLILPQISSKRIEISFGEDVFSDEDSLDNYENDRTYTINVTGITIEIQLPETLGINKFSTIKIENTSNIKDFKRKLLKERKELEKREISLYLSNQELKDETKYEDLIFIKGSKIECKIVFNYICSDESTVKFNNFKGILDKEITVSQCRRKCLDQIRKDPNNKCRNLNRIKLKLNDKTLDDKNGKLIGLLNNEEEFREILVIVEEDKKFTKIKDKDKPENIIFEEFNCESNVSDVRKRLGNDFIIKTDADESTIYDDMPLFSIPGNIYTKNVSDKETKKIKIQFLDDLNERKFEKPREKDFTRDTPVFELKKFINDIYLTGKMNVDDIDLLIQLIPSNAEYPEDYPLINKDNKYRILCDSQDLFTIDESEIFVAKKDITKGTEPMVKLTYMSKGNKDDEKYKENEISIKYDNETTVEDLIKGIEFPKIDNTQPVVLYMGRILNLKSKLNDILVGDERNFYTRLIQKLNKDEDDED